jgi:predicted amidohydrolase
MKPLSRREFARMTVLGAAIAPMGSSGAEKLAEDPPKVVQQRPPQPKETPTTPNGIAPRKPNSTIRIGHWQMESTCGAFEENLERVLQGLDRADRDHVEIVCFPECFLTGYPDTAETARKDAFAIDSPSLRKVLERTKRFEATCIVGFNELRGADIYNTAVVLHRGVIEGFYSKCSAYHPFHKQGREFPVFSRGTVKFGVVICSDGGYIEPSRILAMKGAKIIFSPHYNYISKEYLLTHFMEVRADHVARAVENRVFFVRGNNVSPGKDPGIQHYEGVGYGDSYVMDPYGEIVIRSRRHQEDFIFADIDLGMPKDNAWEIGKSRWSLQEFGAQLQAAAGKGS